MRLIPVNYCGFTAMDRRFSSPMLPWIVSEIRKRDSSEKLSLGVEEAALQAYNSDFEIQFTHKLCMMTRFSQADLDPCTFLYLLRDDTEQLLYCYLFNATKPTDVTDLYQQMKEQSSNAAAPTRSVSSAANLTSLCVDISPSSSNFFEVLYIGKIKVWNKKVPDSFIDDALEKFKLHDLEKARRKVDKLRQDWRRGSVDSTASDTSSNRGTSPLSTLQRSQSVLTNLGVKSPEIDRKVLKSIKSCDGDSDSKENSPAPRDLDKKSASPSGSTSSLSSEKSEHQDAIRQLKITPEEIDDHNRTMVLQVDRTDLRLISPDRKVILLHKHHKDVTTCIQGQIYSDHFGFISKENSNGNTYIGFVFKCESTSVAAEAVGAITQAFNNADTRNRPMVTSCDHCPMVWFHKLCCEVEHLTDKKTQVVIFKRIEQLDEEEQMVILTKFRGAETDSVREQNEFLMMLLRAHCEMKQGRHMHDTAENRSEFLNQYLGGGNTIFMKAKRSLTTSFDNLLKRKASKDDFGPILKDMTLPINPVHKESSPSANNESDSEGSISKSSAVGSQSDLRENHLAVKESNGKACERNGNDKTPKSPMLDIFLKVGSSPKSTVEECSPNKQDVGSWRQAIFKRVVTPNKAAKDGRRRSREELRTLWKKSIHQAVLLIRMEKENARLRARQEETAVKRIKLEYDEMKSVGGAAMEVWELLTNKDPSKIKCDNKMLLHAIKQGIPRGKRGEVWSLLAEQFCARKPPIDTTMFPSFNVPYETLLKQLTSHQHAILIDLGRTFPCHSYFSSPLGPGQLALFNLLKAYSLLDPDVGYCQGLSFVAGVLLLHMEESQAFFLLRHLMFRRGLRKQYLPDMVGLQVRLYQLSRLLHDQLPELYNHFDLYEVAPTLYAAPWLLTIFASQFPLGFVTRVFDLIFLENTEVVFRVAIALLSHHKDQLLACDSFEEIMNYLKTKLPEIDKVVLEKIMKQVYTTDISKQLNEYKVEYQVLQEEMQSVQPQVENVHKLETANKSLTDQNKMLMSQLEAALSNVQRLEATRAVQQSNINQLKTQNRCLEVTISTLASFINGLIEDKLDIEIPGDVRRVMSQISFSERRETKNNFLNTMFRKTENAINPNKIMVKSLSTGRIGIPNIDENQVLRTNSLNAGGFFSKSHNHILQQQKLGSYPTINTLEVKIEDVEEEEEKQRKKALTSQPALPLIETIAEYESKTSPTNSVDSGVDTPSSPKDTNIQASEPHPLSNCDVTFTFNGTRELKKVRSLRHMTRTSSPDLLSK